MSPRVQKGPNKYNLNNRNRHTGIMKFFDEEKGFGFIVIDDDGSDIFCHLDDVKKAEYTMDMIREAIAKKLVFTFECLVYQRKLSTGRKAINLSLTI